jgi:hypothetical protein
MSGSTPPRTKVVAQTVSLRGQTHRFSYILVALTGAHTGTKGSGRGSVGQEFRQRFDAGGAGRGQAGAGVKGAGEHLRLQGGGVYCNDGN